MRFEMARALAARAKERADWIGDDHGDPYEQALLDRKVSIEMHVALKELLDHLRSALDYCAHEICEIATQPTTSLPIYFPITARGFSPNDFPSRVGKLMPGLLKARPDLVPVLANLQPFASPKNGWLADLATLANRTKHDVLIVNSVDFADLKIEKDLDSGAMFYTSRRPDGVPFRMSGLSLIDAPNGLEGADCRSIYLWLAPIEQEMLSFLRPALEGVPNIIRTLEEAI